MTLARTGRSMKNFEIMRWCLFGRSPAALRSSAVADRPSGRESARSSAGDDHAVVGLQAAFDHPQVAHRAARSATLRCSTTLSLVHHQHIASGLIAAERDVGHQQRVRRCLSKGTRTRTK